MGIVAAFAVPHPPLIIPGVADGREQGIAKTVAAYEEVGRRIAELRPETIVISSPHSVMYRDYLHVSPGAGARGSFARFGAPQARYSCDYDEGFARELVDAGGRRGMPLGFEGERSPELDHATMIPLHFVEQGYAKSGITTGYKVVRMGLAGLSPAFHYEVGRLVQESAARLGRRTVYVASGDLSHKLTPDGPYGFAPEGPVFDALVCDAFATGDLTELLTCDHALAERAAECGLRSFWIMVGALDRTAVESELLSYEGPFGVGYGVAALTPVGEVGGDPGCDRLAAYEQARADELARRREAEDPYVRLARLSLETYVRTGRRMARPDGLPAELLHTRAGCFVSLKTDGELRGCIGTIGPVRGCLADEIIANAVSAGTHDPRFSPVREDELDGIVYDVDVLGPTEPVDSWDKLDPTRFGVVVSTDDGRRGLLLPDLDGVDTVREQVEIAARKGHINLNEDDYRLERFEVVRHL